MKKKIFYGWFIVAATLVISTYNSSMFTYGFTTFMAPIAATFGWGYAQIALASSLRGLETGTLDPLIGAAADRWPAKRLMLIGICVFVIGVVCISRATNIAMFYAGFLIVGLGSATTTTMVPMTVLARWFSKNIGKANGLLAAGIALGGLFAPLLVKGIDAFGWQDLMIYMAAGALALGVPLSFVFRDRPQDYGLLPDGRDAAGVSVLKTRDFGTGVKEALRMRAFWFIAITVMFQMAAIGSVAMHMMPHLTSLGIERLTAAFGVTVFSVVSIGSRIFYGFLADAFQKKYLIAVSNVLTAIGLILFGLLDGHSFAAVLLFAVIYGMGAAGATPLRAPITREFFGTKKFGTIYGMMALSVALGSVCATPIAGWVYDTRGTYNPIWFIYAGLTAVGAVLIMLLPSSKGSGNVEFQQVSPEANAKTN